MRLRSFPVSLSLEQILVLFRYHGAIFHFRPDLPTPVSLTLNAVRTLVEQP